MEIGIAAQGQAYRTDGGGRFKQRIHQRNLVDAADQDAAHEEKQKVQEENGAGALERAVLNPPSVTLGAAPFFENRDGAQHQNCKGGSFEAAGR